SSDPRCNTPRNRLQFAYQPGVGVEDAILYLLHRAHSHLDKGSGTVRILFLDFSSAFNTIQPTLLRGLTEQDGSGPPADGLDLRLPHWQTTVRRAEGHHVLTRWDDREEEYRRLVGDFAAWCHTNHLQLNTSKTKELVIDFGRSRPRPRPVLLEGAEVEAVDSYKYLGLWLDNKLDWTTHTSHLYGKTQSRMYFLRRLRKDTSRLDKLIRRAGSVVGTKLDSLVTVAESRTLDKLLDIMDNASHPLHTVISNQRSLFSERLLLPKCRTNRLQELLCPSCHHTLQLLTRGEEDI
ncbi:hypothetical protein L3Q82_009676, partial [Scortum barcoo]